VLGVWNPDSSSPPQGRVFNASIFAAKLSVNYSAPRDCLIGVNQRKSAVNFSGGSMSGFTRDVVSTANAPKAIGPYSQAIKANGFVFISGQVAFDPATGNLIEGGIEAQTEQVLKNLTAILQAAGSSWEKAVKTTVFLKNMAEFGQMNEVYGKICKNAPPARSTVEVARLPKDVAVEIDVIALA
jgi:2-iminobutanoate/2-iminopropanoate deaminase